jgi:hypothetical protein
MNLIGAQKKIPKHSDALKAKDRSGLNSNNDGNTHSDAKNNELIQELSENVSNDSFADDEIADNSNQGSSKR